MVCCLDHFDIYDFLNPCLYIYILYPKSKVITTAIFLFQAFSGVVCCTYFGTFWVLPTL